MLEALYSCIIPSGGSGFGLLMHNMPKDLKKKKNIYSIIDVYLYENKNISSRNSSSKNNEIFLSFFLFVILSNHNACYGCENEENRFEGKKIVLRAVCKHDWQNVRSYLFFNMQKISTKISDSVCNEWP